MLLKQQGDRQRQTDRGTDRQATSLQANYSQPADQRQTDRARDKEPQRKTQRGRDRDKEKDRQTERRGGGGRGQWAVKVFLSAKGWVWPSVCARTCVHMA